MGSWQWQLADYIGLRAFKVQHEWAVAVGSWQIISVFTRSRFNISRHLAVGSGSRQWGGPYALFKVIRFKVQASKLEQPMPGKPVTATLQGCTESMYSFYTGINE